MTIRWSRIGESEVSDTEDCDTAKSLSRGKLYLSSDHMSNVKENMQETFYFAKCSAKPSVQLQSCNVTCTLSLNSGFVVDASCMCLASAMSRYAHIAGLLHREGILLNVSHEAKYGTYTVRKIDGAIHFDPQPPSLKHTSSDSHINCYKQNLQAITKKRHTTMNHACYKPHFL